MIMLVLELCSPCTISYSISVDRFFVPVYRVAGKYRHFSRLMVLEA